MNQEMMIEVDLIGHGVDCRVEVPASMLFQLGPIIPHMLEKIGFEKSCIEYVSMLEDIREKSKQMSGASWFSADADTQVFIRKCQIVAIMGVHLHGLPLMIAGDGLAGPLREAGGIDITEKVDSGEISRENFKGVDLFVERCRQQSS